MARLGHLSLRIKLTLIFVAVMGIVLAGTGSFLFFRTKANLDGAIAQSLRSRAGELVQTIRLSGRTDVGGLIEPGERFAQVLTPAGAVLESRPVTSPALLTPPEAARAARAPLRLARGEATRLLAVPATAGRRRLVAVVAQSLADREHALEGLGRALLIGGPLALLLASALAYGVATAALRPVEAMRRRASEITSADANARLPVPATQDEIHRLATTLNEMLARLEIAAEHERTFVANASHELRTPVATMRTELELALRHASTVDEFRDAARSTIEDADRLSELTDELMALARADPANTPVVFEEVAVGPLLRTVAREIEQDPDRGDRTVRVEDPGSLTIRADGGRLLRALRNMGRNAIVHGAGAIVLGADVDRARVRVWVRDEGAPLPDDVRQAAFDRFARGPDTHDRPGSGLGLSIVDEVARAHGGSARLENVEQGVASVVEIPLDRSPDGERPELSSRRPAPSA